MAATSGHCFHTCQTRYLDGFLLIGTRAIPELSIAVVARGPYCAIAFDCEVVFISCRDCRYLVEICDFLRDVTSAADRPRVLSRAPRPHRAISFNSDAVMRGGDANEALKFHRMHWGVCLRR